MTPDVKLSGRSAENGDAEGDQDPANKSDLLDDEEDFFDFITRFQSKRMDDQRCSLADRQQQEVSAPAPAPAPPGQVAAKEELLDMIAGAQSCRLNEQRAPWNVLPGLNKSKQPEILQVSKFSTIIITTVNLDLIKIFSLNTKLNLVFLSETWQQVVT